MQFGSQVRPELGRTDYTAFLQGANQGSAAMGQGIAALGQGAAIGLQQYYQKKEEKQLLDQTRNRATQFITENPDFAKTVGITDPKDPKAIDAMIKGVGGGDIRRGAMMANQAISQFAEQKRQINEAANEQKAMMKGFEYFKQTEDPAGAVSAAVDAGLKNVQPMVNFINSYAQVLGASPRTKPEIVLTPEQVQEYQSRGMKVEGVPLPDGRIMAKGVSTINPSAPPTTNINMGQNQYEASLGKAVADQHLDLYNKARKSKADIEKLDETIELIQTGDLNTGILADLKTDIDRISSGFFADKKAGKRVADTQILEAMLGSDVFSMISNLGIGARGLDTPAEREFLRDVMTGSKKLDKKSLDRLTKIRRKITAKIIASYNKEVQSGRMKKFFDVSGFSPEPIDIPMDQDELIDSALSEVRKDQ